MKVPSMSSSWGSHWSNISNFAWRERDSTTKASHDESERLWNAILFTQMTNHAFLNACCLFWILLPMMHWLLVHNRVCFAFTPQMKRIRVYMGVNQDPSLHADQSSNKLPQLPKWTALSEKTHQGSFKADQRALVWMSLYHWEAWSIGLSDLW